MMRQCFIQLHNHNWCFQRRVRVWEWASGLGSLSDNWPAREVKRINRQGKASLLTFQHGLGVVGDLSSCRERPQLCTSFAFDLDVITIAGKRFFPPPTCWYRQEPMNTTHCFCFWQRARNHTMQKSSASTSVLASLCGCRCRCFLLNGEGAADGKHLSSAVIGVVRRQPFPCLWFRVNLHISPPGFHPNVKWVCWRLVRKSPVAVANR